MRVRVNSLYTYTPCGWDVFTPCTGNRLESDQIVRVINLPSAPKANTMGQCYVANPYTGEFLCMISCNSLTPLRTLAPELIGKINRRYKAAVASGQPRYQSSLAVR